MVASSDIHTRQCVRAAGARPLERILAPIILCAACSTGAPGRPMPEPARSGATAPADTAAAPDGGREAVVPARSDTAAAAVGPVRADTPAAGPTLPDTARTAESPEAGRMPGEPSEIIATLAEPLRRHAPPDTAGASDGVADTTAADTRGSPLGRLVADAARAATGAHVAIIGADDVVGDLEAGPLTRGAAAAVVPAERRLVRLQLTGGQLHAALEHVVGGPAPRAHVSGVTLWYDPSRPTGRRILTAELAGGAPVRSDRLYTVTVTDPLAAGGAGFDALRAALVVEDTGILARDALTAYLAALAQPVRGPDAARLRAVYPR